MFDDRTLVEIFTDYERAVADEKQSLALELEPWEIVCHARVHLANGLMTSGDVDARQLMAWIQDRLMDPTPQVCVEEFTNRQDGWNCPMPVVTWCGDCGAMTCKPHMTRCCMENRCSGCQMVHESTFHKWLDTQIN